MALPTVITSAGLQPTPPADIRSAIVTKVKSTNPGYTDNLPGSMIEDMVSTGVGEAAVADGARVDSVNSLTPYGANNFLLAQLGAQFGIKLGLPTNTSVFVQFTGTPGFVIQPGFTVSDGTNQFQVIDGGVIGTDRGDGLGVTPLLFALATQSGTFAVPSGTVTSNVTSVPSPYIANPNNPQAGIPSQEAESAESYRARTLNAGLAASSSFITMMKTLLGNVSGVQQRLISVIQLPANAGWEVIVGGGDPFQVAYAIYKSGVDLASLVGSTISVTGVTKANPGVYTTNLNHGLVTGQTGVTVAGSSVSSYNHTGTVTVIDEKNFSFNGFDTTLFANYTSGGVVTPNTRNLSPSVVEFPNTYTVPFVSPPQQTVTVSLTWNTSNLSFVQESAVAQTGAPALADYINSIVVGQPINVFQMEEVFLAAIAGIIDPNLVTRMVFAVSINGVSTPPSLGTGVISGDPESYFLTSSSSITIARG